MRLIRREKWVTSAWYNTEGGIVCCFGIASPDFTFNNESMSFKNIEIIILSLKSQNNTEILSLNGLLKKHFSETSWLTCNK